MAPPHPGVPRNLTWNAHQIAKQAYSAGFSRGLPPAIIDEDSQVTIATAIAMAESGGRVFAHNTTPPDDSYGLWQINMYGSLGPSRRRQYGIKENDDLFDPGTNARAAYKIFQGSGWRAWSVYTSGAYKQHLDEALKGAKDPKGGTSVDGETDTRYGAVLYDPILDFFREAGLRTAGFLAGIILVGAAIYLTVKKGGKL